MTDILRFAVIQGGTVSNVAQSDRNYAQSQGWIESDVAQVGDSYAGGVFTRPPTASPAVPHSVTRRQAKQALLLAGLLGNVQTAIDWIPDATQRALVQIEWDDSLNFERNRPVLIALGTAMGLDSADMDQLFITADTL